jgi:glycosyltransferase involved in cell wall biosynthesis
MGNITVAHIRDSSGLFGAEQVILTLGKNIDRRFRLLLICLRSVDGKSDPLAERARESGYQVIPVAVEGGLNFRSISHIRKIFEEYGVRILHSHDYKSNLYGVLASLRLGIRRVATAHGTTRDSFWKKCYLHLDETVVYRYFDEIIAVSDEIRSQLVKKHIGRVAIRVIENGIDPMHFGSRNGEVDHPPPLPIPKNHKVFAVIGRLFPDKGHRFFLQAFSEIVRSHPAVSALMIGEGPCREEIVRQVHDLGLEKHVYLCGVRSDMKNVYENVDFLVIPSLTEGIPYVLLEAMISKVPVLATEVGGIPKLIEHGVTGYLVSPGDVDSLEKGMVALLSDPSEIKDICENGYRLVTDRYSAGKMVKRIEGLYEALATE